MPFCRRQFLATAPSNQPNRSRPHHRHFRHGDSFHPYPALLHFMLLLSLVLSVNASLQDIPSFNCAGSNFQIDPTRPNNVLVMPSSTGAAPRYQFVPIDMLTRNVCAPALLDPPAKLFPSRYIVTRCDECAKCPHELSNLHRVLTQAAQNANLQSLLVISGKDLERVRGTTTLGGGTSRQTAATPENALAKFVFSTEEEPSSLLTYCELPGDSADTESLKNFSKTSVLFVSISFIILIVISLAWLVFYYVQRFRYAHAKDRLQRRLFNAAKKALARIPTRPVKAGDKELNSDCPVCIDPYKPGDICRQLPCRHIFHKSCVDPWLLEHRTCPMCKSDILKAFGYHISGRRRAQFSANVDEDGPTGEHDLQQRDREDRLSIESGSESVNPFPVVTEVHDPFGFTPSASPQLIQMVNTDGFQIIPLPIQSRSSSREENNRHCEIIQASIERHAADLAAMVDQQQLQQQAGTSSSTIPTASSTDPTADCAEKCADGVPVASAVEFKGMPKGQQPEEQQTQPKKAPKESTGLRLFRAVTGRRHVNPNVVHVRSRSFSSQAPFTAIQIGQIGGSGGNGTNGDGGGAIIYSVADGTGAGGENGTTRAISDGPTTTGATDGFRFNGGKIVLPANKTIDRENHHGDAPAHPQHRVVTTATGGGFRRKSPPTTSGSGGQAERAKSGGIAGSAVASRNPTKQRDEATRVDMDIGTV